MDKYLIIFIPLLIIAATITIVKWENVKVRFKEVWKELRGKASIVLLLFITTSCFSQKTATEPIVCKLICEVVQVKNNEAILQTGKFKVQYVVDHKDFDLGKQYLFVLLVHPSDNIRIKRAKVLGFSITPKQATLDARELMAQYD